MIRSLMKDILPSQPYHISGYTGFVQGIKFDCGQSYGRLTNKLFTIREQANDPSKPALADIYETVDYGVEDKMYIEEKRCRERECVVYKMKMIPGYAGHVPMGGYRVGTK